MPAYSTTSYNIFAKTTIALITKTLYAQDLSDEIETDKAISKEQAEMLFIFFRDSTVFHWQEANNDCEDRANAICILLDEWKIQNGKGWVFSGYMFKKIGYLKNLWKYHVAALLPVREGDDINYYIIDPATSDKLITIEEWSANITDNPHSYHLIKKGNYYIFNSGKIEKNNWCKSSKRSYNWTIQGLCGINGVSKKGKAQLSFNKGKILKTASLFKQLKKVNPLS